MSANKCYYEHVPLLNKWLSTFVVEAQREDREWYPATTITNLLSGPCGPKQLLFLWSNYRGMLHDSANSILSEFMEPGNGDLADP